MEAQGEHQEDGVDLALEAEAVVVVPVASREVELAAAGARGVDLLVEGVDLLSLFALLVNGHSGVWGMCVKIVVGIALYC